MESKDFESFLFFFGKAVTDERRVLEKAESFYMVALGLLTLSSLNPQASASLGKFFLFFLSKQQN